MLSAPTRVCVEGSDGAAPGLVAESWALIYLGRLRRTIAKAGRAGGGGYVQSIPDQVTLRFPPPSCVFYH